MTSKPGSDVQELLANAQGHDLLSNDEHKWTAPRHIPRLQGFDATVPHFYEAPSADASHLEVWCYTDRISYSPGDTVNFHVSTTGEQFSIEVLRDGRSPSRVFSLDGQKGAHYSTPDDFYERGCGWPSANEWTLPDDLPSGFYLVLTRTRGEDGTLREHEHGFCVRPARPQSDIAFVLCTSTWLAYSDWGGTNNYQGLAPGTSNGKAHRISIHKPWARGFMYLPEGAPRKPHEYVHGPGAIPRYPPLEFAYARGYSKFYASAGWATFERNFALWAEDNAYELDYLTQTDLHNDPELLDAYKCVVTVGHDEYWSWEMRDHLDRWVESGGRLARFAGNFAWQVRLEDDGDTQVCYKEDAAQDPIAATGQFNRISTIWDVPGAGRPGPASVGVCALSGVYALVGHQAPHHSGGFTVYRAGHWALEGTDLRYGDQLGSAARIFGYEVDGLDVQIRNGLPYATGRDGALPGTEIIALGLASIDEVESGHKGAIRFYGAVSELMVPVRYGPEATEEERQGAAFGNGVIVTAPKGEGELFCAGTCEWVNGLKLRDPFVERITHNVLRRYASAR